MTDTSPTPVVSPRAPATRLDLYVSSTSPDSDLAIANLRAAVQERPSESMPAINIIDVHTSPLIAYREGIFVTPTLVVTVDGQRRTMFGNLSNPEVTRAVLAQLL